MPIDDTRILKGSRFVIDREGSAYPDSLQCIQNPPEKLYVIGNLEALQEGLAVIGARKATPYGISCAQRFASYAAKRNVVIISGGARGCDAAAHNAALKEGGKTVAFLGGGCDCLYPLEHKDMFQRIVDAGGAVVSEQPWQTPPLPWMFRLRNRLIAGLAKGTLIVEAGLPSGTFSTADESLSAGKEVLVVPGAITSEYSRGANLLIQQGATPIIDNESFEDALFHLFGCLKQQGELERVEKMHVRLNPVLEALRAEPLGMEDLYQLSQKYGGQEPRVWLMEVLAEAMSEGIVARYPDGRYGPC